MNKLRASTTTLQNAEERYSRMQSMGISNGVKPVVDEQSSSPQLSEKRAHIDFVTG
jgi:hypothetical protein